MCPHCKINTAGNHEYTCPRKAFEEIVASPKLPEYGWICPKCDSVYAPHVSQCGACNSSFKITGY